MGYIVATELDKQQFKIAKQGETLTVPPMVHHTFWNEGSSTLLVRVTVNGTRAQEFQQFFCNFYGIIVDEKYNVSLWQMLLTMLHGPTRISQVPLLLQDGMQIILQWLGRFVLHMQPGYAEYSCQE